ncbi:c-type cytochrome [Vulgatibacter sp.]|uniref:c-type cytochrome n=1 Tax=Vulgatibacter sp. TaxID=1971226 RepID=UPI00356686A8
MLPIRSLGAALAGAACAVVVVSLLDRRPAEPPAPPPPAAEAAVAPANTAFAPPDESAIPAGPFGEMVRYGRDLFLHTEQLRGTWTENGMDCVNCHLDAGRLANAAPMWASWTMYPAYRSKTQKVDTMAERIQGCFLYSMNGKAPPVGSKELAGLMSYIYWLSSDAPTGVELEGRGFAALPPPAQGVDHARGEAVYEAKCAVCHGAEGEGKVAEGSYVFPPLWGSDSYNWGAGMHRIDTAASFIKHNMPLGQGGSLTDQEAWDVATFVNSHERPPDPRDAGNRAATDAAFHDENCRYGDEVDGRVLAGVRGG